jgi:hypothetical protein
LDLDERLATTETTLEIKRCYTYIGTPLIRTHAPEAGEGSEGSVGVNSHASAIPEAQPSGVAENTEIRDTEGVTGADAANEPTEIYATKETLDEQ